MSVPVDWKEVQELNKLPLNQLAKQALKLEKEAPDPTGLYLLQLLEWALESGKVKLGGPLTQQSVIQAHLEAFWTWARPE